MRRFGDGLGLGADLLRAARDAVEQALDGLGGPPDLAVVSVSATDPGSAVAAGELAESLLGARAVIGCTAEGVLGAGRAVEGPGAVSVFVAQLPGVHLRTFHLEVLPSDAGVAVVGLPERVGDDEVALLLSDPWSFPVDGFVARAAAALPGLPFLGGVASGGQGPGSTRLWVDGRTVDRGAVGVLLAGSGARALVSQGCRPIGPAMTVTSAAGNVVRSLAGVPAVEKVREVLSGLPPAEQALASAGVQLGITADEYADDADYLVRAVLGTEPETGGLVVGELIQVGQTVRLQVRDADVAHESLRELLAGAPPAEGALLFSCSGRGAHLFGPTYGGAGHDGDVVRAGLGAQAVAGFFAGGEVGPAAGRTSLHTFAAAVLAFP